MDWDWELELVMVGVESPEHVEVLGLSSNDLVDTVTQGLGLTILLPLLPFLLTSPLGSTRAGTGLGPVLVENASCIAINFLLMEMVPVEAFLA